MSVRAYFGGDDDDDEDDFEDEEIDSDFFPPKGKVNPPKNNKRRDVGHEFVLNYNIFKQYKKQKLIMIFTSA